MIEPLRKLLTQLKDLGATLEPISIPSMHYALSAYYVLASAEASSNLAKFDGIRYGFRSSEDTERKFHSHIAKTRTEAFGKEVQKRIVLGTYSLASDHFDNYFLQAQRVRRLLRRDFDKVFCFYCKLFNSKYSTSQLGNEGTKDWRNLSSKLKSHETSNEHITNMNVWVDMELRLLQNKTIDKSI